MSYLFGIAGFLFGAALADPGIAVLGGLLGYLLIEHLRLRRRIETLEQRAAHRPVADTAAPPLDTPDTTSATVVPAAIPAPAAVPASADLPPPAAPAISEEALVFDVELPDTESLIAPTPPPDPFTRAAGAVIGFFTGGNALVRVGVVVLFFGVAFLLKYAVQNAWLPLELRLAGVALGGLVMLALGWRLRQREAGYGLVLQGGGIGVLYLTVFAAFRLYGLLPPTLAFGILVACTLLAGSIAVLQNSRSLAVFAAAGGFLAPVLASTGQGSHVLLFSYYLVLNAGILGVAWFKAWRLLNLIGFVFTFVIASLWGLRYYQPEFFATTEPFLILFVLFYVAIAILYALRQPPRLRGYVDGTLVFGTPLIGCLLQAGLVAGYEYGLAWSALSAGIFYLVLAWLLRRQAAAGTGLLAAAFLAIGVVFVSLAIPLALEARLTAALWALEGAGLLWIGVRQEKLAARLFGLLLQFGAAGFHALAGFLYIETLAFLNSWFLDTLLITAAALFSAYYLWRHRARLRPWEQMLVPVMFAWGLLWWLQGGLRQIILPDFRDYRHGGLLLFLTTSTALALYGWRRLDWPLLRLPVLALLPALALALLATAADINHPFTQLGYIGWPLALALHYFILYRLDEVPLSRYLRWLHAGALWLLLLVLTWELAWSFDRLVRGSDTWELVVWGLLPTLAALALLTLGRRLAWPLRRHAEVYLGLGARPIAVYLWCWLLVANAIGPADPRPLPYLPLLNPLDITIATVLLTLWYWLRQERTPLAARVAATCRAVLAISAFYWLNGILLRTLHHWADVPFRLQAMLDSVLVQAGLSLLWSACGVTLMLFAARRGGRQLWLTGAGLMVVVVIKLFLIDLAATGTVERIVAFLAVGLLLLIVGYFAPAPPRSADLSTPDQ